VCHGEETCRVKSDMKSKRGYWKLHAKAGGDVANASVGREGNCTGKIRRHN
jgi:hypothetical protein